MKNRLKGLLAVVLSMACFLSTTPITGFAAGKLTVKVSEGNVTAVDSDGNTLSSPAVVEADEIIAADGKGMFYVTVNGQKAAEGYGEKSYKGYTENNPEAEESGNTYFDTFTVPAAPKGYTDGATVTSAQSKDYYNHENTYHLGNIVNIEYSPISYKVNFDLNGGEGKIEAISAKYNAEFTLPSSDSASNNGTSVKSWNTKADGSGTNYETGASVKNLSETNGEEITLYAQWGENETKEYTVTYYLTETEQYDEIQSYKEGETIVLPSSPEKEGFKFAGWILGEENGEAIKMPAVMPKNDIKAYASWEINQYEINYVVDGTNYITKVAPYGSDITLTVPADPEKADHVFAGWFDAEGNNLYSYTTVPAKDVVFTAKWIRNGNVVYMVGNKTYKAYEVKEGEKVPVPEENPQKFAHKFKGWSPAVPEYMPAEDLTFTAQWEIDKEFVTIVIGGTVVAGGILAAITGAGITGISIIGGIIALLGVTSGINKTYTVTYKVDGSVYKTYKLEPGKKITVPANPSKEGYKFAGWTPDIPDEMPKKNLTFEAKWEKEKDDSNIGSDIPSTGSTSAGIAAFAALAVSAAIAVLIKKKKDK